MKVEDLQSDFLLPLSLKEDQDLAFRILRYPSLYKRAAVCTANRLVSYRKSHECEYIS